MKIIMELPEMGNLGLGESELCVPIRGGGWKSYPLLCRSANRNDEFRNCDVRYSDVGFRIALKA